MNYKESAQRLNEFNEFMDDIKVGIALRSMGYHASKITFKQFAEALLNIKMPVSFEIHGLKFNNNYK